MEPIKELEGKKIAIIGLGASQIDYVIGKENSVEWDEVWVINSALSVFECDRVFMLDPVSRFLDTDDAGNQTNVMRKLLPKFEKPLYTCELGENVPLQERLYGYHRLANPKVAMPNPEGEWVVCDRSELAQMVKKHNLETVELTSSPEPYKG